VRPASSAGDRAAAAAVVVLGSAFLAARVAILARPDRVALLGAGYALMLAASIVAPVPPGVEPRPSRASALVVMLAGVGAVAAAGALVGSPPPWPAPAWAPAFEVTAAVAEEALFRRVVYAWFERRFGPAVAVAVTAAAFGLVHVPVYGSAVLPVDVGAGLLLSWQRAASGRWSVPAATHAVANLLVAMR
jgi:membrane protease YdiL (CAAX protease family)